MEELKLLLKILHHQHSDEPLEANSISATGPFLEFRSLILLFPTVTSASNSNTILNLNVSYAPINTVVSIPPPTNMLMKVNPFPYAFSTADIMPIPPPFYTTTTTMPHTTPYVHPSNVAIPVSGHQVLVPPNLAHTYPLHMNVYSHPSNVLPLHFNHAPRPKFSFNPHHELEFPKFNEIDPKG